MYNVIDVSEHNGKIDFIKVKEAGIYGVIIKVASSANGWKKDSLFEENYKNATNAGLEVGAYFASYDTSIGAGKRSAVNVIKELKGKHFSLPIFYDFEYFNGVAQAQKSMGNDAFEMVKAFCKTLENAGYFAGVYSTTSIFNSQLPFKTISKDFVTWLADWRESADMEKAHSSCLWQYTNKGRVDGVNGDCDMNYFYRKDIVDTIKQNGLNGYPMHDGKLYEVSAIVSKGDLERIITLSQEVGKEFDIFIREVKAK